MRGRRGRGGAGVGRRSWGRGLGLREWAEAKWRAELTKAVFLVNLAHGVIPTGRVLRAGAVLELSQEAATYGRLLSLFGLF